MNSSEYSVVMTQHEHTVVLPDPYYNHTDRAMVITVTLPAPVIF